MKVEIGSYEPSLAVILPDWSSSFFLLLETKEKSLEDIERFFSAKISYGIIESKEGTANFVEYISPLGDRVPGTSIEFLFQREEVFLSRNIFARKCNKNHQYADAIL